MDYLTDRTDLGMACILHHCNTGAPYFLDSDGYGLAAPTLANKVVHVSPDSFLSLSQAIKTRFEQSVCRIRGDAPSQESPSR